MSTEVFNSRWRVLQGLRAQGHVELMDVLGRYADLGPLVRTGLLRRRELNDELQRYHGYVPTEVAQSILVHAAEHELIMVRKGRTSVLRNWMEQDPLPGAPFKDAFAEPTGAQFEAVEHMAEGGRARADQLRSMLFQGYMDSEVFCNRHGVLLLDLIALGLCTRSASGTADHRPRPMHTAEGALYLLAIPENDLLLVRPGMELPLLQRCSMDVAQVFIRIPMATSDVLMGEHPRRASWV